MLVEEHPGLDEVQVDLLNEERVPSVSRSIIRANSIRRWLPGQRPQHRAYAVEGEPAQVYPFHQAAATQLADDSGQGMLKIHFDIPVGAEDQHRHLGQQRRQVLGEQQGRLVGPVEVLQDQQERLGLRSGR